ncbi:hypothetical protein H5410_051624 [Solanum commersonii]|uniref:Uncharacterized protein n=1 Tax=Solanum commersonii TaxID=4109 RepID=A0A9J5X0L7_SOLCO|nr:hypothetical protein H5410_051624 [Solanum commersonii]
MKITKHAYQYGVGNVMGIFLRKILLEKILGHVQYYKYLKLEQEFLRQKDRRKRLKISRIQKANGSWEDENKVLKEAVNFYKDQFSSSVEEDDTYVINLIPPLVNEEDIALLNRHPSFEEVRKVVFELKGESATELDGFIGFVKTYMRW